MFDTKHRTRTKHLPVSHCFEGRLGQGVNLVDEHTKNIRGVVFRTFCFRHFGFYTSESFMSYLGHQIRFSPLS